MFGFGEFDRLIVVLGIFIRSVGIFSISLGCDKVHGSVVGVGMGCGWGGMVWVGDLPKSFSSSVLATWRRWRFPSSEIPIVSVAFCAVADPTFCLWVLRMVESRCTV